MNKNAAFLVRRLELGDAARAAELIRAVFGGIHPPLNPPPSAIGETAETVARQLGEGGGIAAEGGGSLVGAVLWKPLDDALYMGRLSVAPLWRRRGLAIALVGEVEAEARNLGLWRVCLGVRLVRAGNRALFAGLGFIEGSTHAHPGFTCPTWVEMDKRLAP